MACGPNKAQAQAWRIRSVALRTRDGQARLDQAYRRLLSDRPADPLASISAVGRCGTPGTRPAMAGRRR
jgi:hypothetical protein